MAALADGDAPSERCDITLQSDGGVLKTVLKAAPVAANGVAVGEALEGTRFKPIKGDMVSVNYTGRIASTNAIFDCTNDIEFSRGHGPLQFPAGQGKVVQGFDLAVLSMTVGEKAVFYIRQDYGYGATGCPGQGAAPTIEPETDLVFEMELVSVGDVADNLTKAAEREAEDRERLKLLRAEREALQAKAAEEAQAKKDKKAEEDKKAAEEAAAAATGSGDLTTKDIKKMNPKSLKTELKKRGLSIEGNKKILAERLLASIA